jgi:DNA-directed RNA polymerase alpha subunit
MNQFNETNNISDVGRNERILALREQGATLREIASLFDLSRERIRQICVREKIKLRDRETEPTLEKLVCKRIRKALRHNAYKENLLEDPQKVAALGSTGLLRIRNIGRKSVQELARALLRLGLIREEDQWHIPLEQPSPQSGWSPRCPCRPLVNRSKILPKS